MSDVIETADEFNMGQYTVKLSKSLRTFVDDLIVNDPRFVGFAPFLANITFAWSYAIPTACAGFGFIFFNPDFYESLPDETRRTVIAHEIWHLIHEHVKRGEGFQADYYNQAADHVINNGLKTDGFSFAGTDPCLDPQYANMSTEQVYDMIYTQKKEEDREQLQTPRHPSPEKIKELVKEAMEMSGQGTGDDSDEDLEKQQAESEGDLDDFLKQIPGNLPGSSVITLLNQSQFRVIPEGADFKKIFAPYLIEPLGGGKRSFMRPNRRMQRSGSLVLPGRSKHKGNVNRLTHLVYALDVSGSISYHMAQQFHNSVKSIKELLNPTKLTVLFFDTQIVLEKTFEDTEQYKEIKVNAGGGTDLRGVYKRARELKPEALVVFTDLYVTIPAKPDHDVIWLIPNSIQKVRQDLYGEVFRIPDVPAA